MDGFTGFKTATTEKLPDAVAVMDPFHGHRGRKDDPLHRSRRSLHTGADLLTDNSADDCMGCSPPTPTSRSKRP